MQLLAQHREVVVALGMQEARRVRRAPDRDAVALGEREVRVAVAVRGRVAAAHDVIVIVAASATAIGRCVSACGATGTSANAASRGSRIGPPADSAYAVEPVGVATMMPSARIA